MSFQQRDILTNVDSYEPMLGLMRPTQGRNAVTPVKLKPSAPRSRVKRSSTEPLRSQTCYWVVCRSCSQWRPSKREYSREASLYLIYLYKLLHHRSAIG